MNKNNVIEKEGVVETSYPNAVFSVRLTDGKINDHLIKATLAGRLRKHKISILPGDKVKVELSVYDLSKGRITYRN